MSDFNLCILCTGRFTHYTIDNIDIKDHTLDGTNTFHATQMAAWQRGPEPDNVLSELHPSSDTLLRVPEILDSLLPANIQNGKVLPSFSNAVDAEWFIHEDTDAVYKAKALDLAIKNATRQKRSKAKKIRRVIESRNVPLPKDWDSFIGLGANKADLACFLSEELIDKAPENKTVIVSGGYQEVKDVKCSKENIDLSSLRANHEEADT